ncbi:Phenolphthiocerol synthesis polyketide synthase type I Pks15/1 [Vibrio ruber DSM 16370]|uniref:Phenolphthiocerol synthesis polyketide synthase type I Pks15/1 n=1 Tax=Vibrio ruber (strain DSM 16370 / JCM 11486 / BCRC 17186 / CECT 7878 / LMG 23124 / VR1) TaxID=1123498 RepID=A0A1R4LR23_VIBR1|nr:type I polyketide synthase [Vibrio ruber]SJN59051.1 Phenolphthiocerol synthesis polyketide synthase type I Pks15/1 [Vibrio ruber DSM 16370]
MEKYLQQIGHLSRNQLLLLAARQQQSLEHQQQSAEQRSIEKRPDVQEPIAIVGMACRFPGDVRDPQSFWEALENGRDLMCQPEAIGRQFDSRHPEDLCMGLLRDIDLFDAAFFGLSEREVEQMDPQQRLLLEVSWEALECAGYNPRGQKESLTGVFIGISSNDYGRFSTGGDKPSLYSLTGNAGSVAAGRIAYMLGLQGPTVSIDTACSSSLVSLHLACQSLKMGESNMALVGGVNLILDPYNTASFYDAGMLASDGHCKTFDASADGFARAEGCGMVVLKRLSDAQRDGDNIRAVISGSAVNQDGRSQGLTAPNELSQVKLLRAALKNAGMSTSDIDYIECHGTGTALGDPIEFSALATVFGDDQARRGNLIMGAVKTNMGHAEAASGMAGLLKTILSIEHGVIPPNKHFHHPSPHILWEKLPVEFPTQCMMWSDTEHPRTAGISAFGFSGTNAHIVLTQAPEKTLQKVNQAERSHHILTLSAETSEALATLAKRYNEMLSDKEYFVGDVGFSANFGRYAASHRLAIVAENTTQLKALITQYIQGTPSLQINHAYSENEKKIAFLFSGQGSQYAGMGYDLYRSSPVFRQVIDRCETILASELDYALTSLLWGEHTHLMRQTEYTQPVLFAFEYALATLWQSWGIQPDILIGHSLGEYVAACIAGVFSLEDGLKLVATRGRLLTVRCQPGSMMSIAAPTDVVATMILSFPGVVIAAENGPASTVVAGDTDCILALEAHLQAQSLTYQMLVVSHAFHSPLVEPMCEAFTEVLSQIKWARPQLPVISNLTGELAGEQLCTPEYWLNHLCEPVKFYQGVQRLDADGVDTYLEVGPSATLLSMARQCFPSSIKPVLWLPSLRRGHDEWLQILTAASQLYVYGQSLDWQSLEQGFHRQRVTLPTYPFEVTGRSFWCQKQEKSSLSHHVTAHSINNIDDIDSVLLPQIIPMAEDEWLCCLTLDQHHPDFLQDHRVQGTVVVPAAMFIELALEAGRVVLKDGPLSLSSIDILRMLVIPDGEKIDVQVKIKLLQDGTYRFSIHSHQFRWEQHCSGIIESTIQVRNTPQHSLQQIQQQCRQEISMSEYYTHMAQGGLELGRQFQTLKQIWNGEQVALARIGLLEESEQKGYCLHPLLMDACFQILSTLIPEDDEALYLPRAVNQIRLFSKPDSAQVWATARLISYSPERLQADFELITDDGQLVAMIEGLQLVPFSGQHATPMTFYQRQWIEWKPDENEDFPLVQQTWLIFADQSGFAQKLADILADEGHQVTLAYADSIPSESVGHSHNQLVLDPNDKCGFEQLLSIWGVQIESTDNLHIVYCWSLDTYDDVVQSSRLNGAGILNLIQAVPKTLGSDIPQLTFVTEQVHSVFNGTEDPVMNPASAMLWGIADVIRIEHPEFGCLSVDLQCDEQSGYIEQARQLCRLIHRHGKVDQVAIRRGSLWKAELRSVVPSQQSHTNIRHDRSYLVTGAFGGIGQQVTTWLAEQGAGHLILLSRSEPQEAPDVLEERLGVPVTVLTCDVSKAESLNFALSQVSEQIFPLAGILHLAGEAHDTVLMKQTWDDFSRVLAPKVWGSWHLHQFTEERAIDLDFFVCFSSVASLFGSAGQAAYASANAFMDGLMQYRCQRGLPGISINWGRWDDTGMAKQVSGHLEKVGLLPISAEQGVQALFWLLGTNESQIGAFNIDWVRFFEYLPEGLHLSILDSVRQTISTQSTSIQSNHAVSPEITQWHHLPPTEQQQQLEIYVRRQVTSLLGHGTDRHVRPRDKFFDIGFDSMMAVELKNRLQSGLGLTLSPTLLFDYPNLQALSCYLGELVFEQSHDDESDPTQAVSGNVDDIKSLDDSDIDKLLDDLIEENVL